VKTDQLCEGSGKKPPETKTRPASWAGSGTWGKCDHCTRILVLKKDGTVREHQVRNRNTRSLDQTRDFLWETIR
jgi:hypothetical protein